MKHISVKIMLLLGYDGYTPTEDRVPPDCMLETFPKKELK